MSHTLRSATLLLALSLTGLAAADWRLELLEEEGIGTSREELRKALKGDDPGHEDLQDAYRRLGAEGFAERETAQKELLRGGDATAAWLRNQERSDDPEVRRRVQEILTVLGAAAEDARDTAVEHAIRSLLAEGDQRRTDTGGLFYEWFGEDQKELGERYRLFTFLNSANRNGWVAKGRLHFPGNGGLDGDQRLVLPAERWPGRETFGKELEISARLGGEDNGVGAWHLGLTIGNIRALYHPGMHGGAFRFEEVDLNDELTPNASVGFHPSSEHLQWMSLKARELPDGRVRLDAVLKSAGKNPQRFERSITVTREQIGKLDEVSADRSGRTGGTARFEDVLVRVIRK